jgi:hypothetical protein
MNNSSNIRQNPKSFLGVSNGLTGLGEVVLMKKTRVNKSCATVPFTNDRSSQSVGIVSCSTNIIHIYIHIYISYILRYSSAADISEKTVDHFARRKFDHGDRNHAKLFVIIKQLRQTNSGHTFFLKAYIKNFIINFTNKLC